jgi:hypothetical protein
VNKCLFVAPLVSHATAGRLAAFINSGVEVSVLDISTRKFDLNLNTIYPYSSLKRIKHLDLMSFGKFYSKPSLLHMIIDGLRSCSIISENSHLTKIILNYIKEVNPDFIVIFYGPLGIHFTRIIKKIAPEISIIFIPNLLPSTVISGNNLIRFVKKLFINEFIDYKRWVNRIDFIFCASIEMQEFLSKKFLYPKSKTEILPDYHPNSFFISTSLVQNKSQENYDIIFLGAPERWGGKIDNLDNQLISLSNSGINIYTSELLITNSYNIWKTYPYFKENEVFTGELSKFAHKFSAALVTYNISTRSERFRTTLPTRFFSALAAGIPIAVKGGLFDAVENFILKNGNGFIYETESQLNEILNDKNKMESFREKAIVNMVNFTAENQKSQILRILKLINKF